MPIGKVHPRFIDLTGQKMHQVTFLKFFKKEGTAYYWKCRCDCGKNFIVRSASVKYGDTKSCGCYRKLKCTLTKTTHGMSKRDNYYYKLWLNLKNRCFNKRTPDYKYYGARGIQVHPEWKIDFYSFYSYIVNKIGPRPSRKHTLDRINNSLGYLPNNLRWATMKTQCNNRRPRLPNTPSKKKL